MVNNLHSLPVIMTFSGLDPTGGAGVQADIESISSMNAHCSPIITALTVQNSLNVQDSIAVDSNLISRQAKTILADMSVRAFKLGVLGSVSNIESIHNILQEHPDLPVIFDPVLAAGGGKSLSNNKMLNALRELLLPRTTVLTPNSREARVLTDTDNLDTCAQILMKTGCKHVLITGTHENTSQVINSLYSDGRKLEDFHYQRLDQEYHGSGCTLASALAALLAQGMDIFNAVHEAQEYTWESLRQGWQAGKGQHFPQRFFWAKS